MARFAKSWPEAHGGLTLMMMLMLMMTMFTMVVLHKSRFDLHFEALCNWCVADAAAQR